MTTYYFLPTITSWEYNTQSGSDDLVTTRWCIYKINNDRIYCLEPEWTTTAEEYEWLYASEDEFKRLRYMRNDWHVSTDLGDLIACVSVYEARHDDEFVINTLLRLEI